MQIQIFCKDCRKDLLQYFDEDDQSFLIPPICECKVKGEQNEKRTSLIYQ